MTTTGYDLSIINSSRKRLGTYDDIDVNGIELYEIFEFGGYDYIVMRDCNGYVTLNCKLDAMTSVFEGWLTKADLSPALSDCTRVHRYVRKHSLRCGGERLALALGADFLVAAARKGRHNYNAHADTDFGY